MAGQVFRTPMGDIHYWVDASAGAAPWLVLLPGLTADHHLFDKQLEYFHGKLNLLTWDAPAHGDSRPFELKFSMGDLAHYLNDILEKQGIARPVFV